MLNNYYLIKQKKSNKENLNLSSRENNNFVCCVCSNVFPLAEAHFNKKNYQLHRSFKSYQENFYCKKCQSNCKDYRMELSKLNWDHSKFTIHIKCKTNNTCVGELIRKCKECKYKKLLGLGYLEKPLPLESKKYKPVSHNTQYPNQARTLKQYLIDAKNSNPTKTERELIYSFIYNNLHSKFEYIYNTIIADSNTDNILVIEHTVFCYLIIISAMRPGFSKRKLNMDELDAEGLHSLSHERFSLNEQTKMLTIKYFGKAGAYIFKKVQINEEIILKNLKTIMNNKKEDEKMFMYSYGKSYSPKDYLLTVYPSLNMIVLRKYHATLLAFKIVANLENNSRNDQKFIAILKRKICRKPLNFIRFIFNEIIKKLDHDTDDKILYYIDPRLVFRLFLIFFDSSNAVLLFDKTYENLNRIIAKRREQANKKKMNSSFGQTINFSVKI
jgi:hypothetical protein